ncbi:MAG TPA: hypothetical protein ENK02_15825 [Planctomycetes bacterium]|nr:hypothetical protein [Planctomycetota bacterium]
MTRLIGSLLALFLLGSLSAQVSGLQVTVHSGLQKPVTQALLGPLPPKAPRATGQATLRDGVLLFQGGRRVSFSSRGFELPLAGGGLLGLDARGRVVTGGKVLTRRVRGWVRLCLADGLELRLRTGNLRKGPREMWAVLGKRRFYLLRERERRQEKQKPFTGFSFYLSGAEDRVVSLAGLGPFVLERPVAVRGGDKHLRVHLLADLLRRAGQELRARTPRNSAQFPRAYSQALFLERVVTQLFPPEKAHKQILVAVPEFGLSLAFQGGVSLMLREGLGGRSGQLVLGLRLEPQAPVSVEYRVLTRGFTVQRVLPEKLQQRSRTFGPRPLIPGAASLLPWIPNLAHPAQRELSMRAIRPFFRRGAYAVPASSKKKKGS